MSEQAGRRAVSGGRETPHFGRTHVTYATVAAFHRYGAKVTGRTGGYEHIRSGRARCELVMKHKVEVEFDEFGWAVLTETAQREGVAIEELVVHAAMYYLADQDVKRVARRPLGKRTRRTTSFDASTAPQSP